MRDVETIKGMVTFEMGSVGEARLSQQTSFRGHVSCSRHLTGVLNPR